MTNPFWDKPPDLSRLPAHNKEGISKPSPMRDSEVRARIIMLPPNPRAGLNHPSGRFYASPYKPNAADESRIDGIQLEMLDFKGLTPLVLVAIESRELPAMFKQLLRSYKRCGGDMNALRNMVEEIDT